MKYVMEDLRGPVIKEHVSRRVEVVWPLLPPTLRSNRVNTLVIKEIMLQGSIRIASRHVPTIIECIWPRRVEHKVLGAGLWRHKSRVVRARLTVRYVLAVV
jgi:hypothetical protein